MPHLVVEYSANLDSQLEIQDVLQVVHDAVLETGVFPLGGVRTRAARRENYVIADGDPAHAFVHVVARIREGRDLPTRQKVGQHIFDAICNCLAGVFDNGPLAISFEIQEIDKDLGYKKNNLHERLRAEGAPNGV